MPLHFLGGFWIATLIVFVSSLHPRLSPLKETGWLSAIVVLGLTLALGVTWEFFEMFLSYLTDNLSCFFIGPKNRYVDTMLDLGLDGLGSLASVWIIFGKKIVNRE